MLIKCGGNECCLAGVKEGRRLARMLFAGCFFAIMCGLTYVFLKAYNEYKVVCCHNTRLERMVDEVEEDFLLKRDYWNILLKHPDGFKDMVRRHFGFVEPTEIVFKFKHPGRG